MAQERITVNTNWMGGLPCIRDTRLPVSAVLGQLDGGASVDEVLDDYPYLEPKDVAAVLAYAVDSRLSDLGLRAHRLVEFPEGELIDDEASVKRLLDS